MAQALAFLSLLRQLTLKELNSVSSLGLNNFLFCLVFLMAGSTRPGVAFWSTLLFQIVILIPLLAIVSVDSRHRFPRDRVGTWPLTRTNRFLLSAVSFIANPLLIVLFLAYLFWMGLAVATSMILIGLLIHFVIFALGDITLGLSLKFASRRIPQPPVQFGGIAQQTWRELAATLDFWTALLIALSGTLYRLAARSPEHEAFPALALFVGIAMSTVAQRMMSLDEGRSLLRFRLLPIAGWKLLLTQDITFLVLLSIMVAALSLKSGIALGMVALAVGRYPSLRQQAHQRRWRFVGGDLRFGAAQVVLGVASVIGVSIIGLPVLCIVFIFYLGSLFWGGLLWNRGQLAQT